MKDGFLMTDSKLEGMHQEWQIKRQPCLYVNLSDEVNSCLPRKILNFITLSILNKEGS